MSQVLDAIKSRRSVKAYKPDQVPQELVDQIMEAGLYAANAMGQQQAIIIQISDKKTRDELSALNRQVGGWQGDFDPFYGAPTVLVVLAKKDWGLTTYDGSLVMGNLMLAAHDLGVDSCWIHRAKEEFESDWGKALLQKLGIEGEYEGVGNCILGYRSGEYPQAKPRKENRIYKVL